MINLNCNSINKLPHIYLPEIDAIFMIDTGSTRSFISSRKADQYFSDYKYYEPFEVISTHARSMHNEVIYIPLLKTFNSNEKHKFYIYDVDNRYDGLIGSDLLKMIDATIDMKNQILRTKNTEIPIVYSPSFEVAIEPRSETRVRVPTDLKNGEAIIDFQDFGNGVRMPSALVTCIDSFATTVIQNTSDTKTILTFTEPITTTEFNNSTCIINLTDTDDLNQYEVDEILKENLSKLRLDHTNSEERKAIETLCFEYRDIFYSEKLPLTFSNQVKHQIRTKNEEPIFIRPYRLAPSQNAEIQAQTDKLLKDNVIQESFSPWSAPVHLVPKKMDASGEPKLRMVIDYRRLNDLTIDDKYPLPNINDIFDKLGKSTYFSTLDLASGYHQIEVEPQDRSKTAFTTPSGHYEFTRMPFGLKTAPATFQRAMDNVLRGLQGIHCLVYLDDIIIYSNSIQEHIEKLRKVFDRLRQTNFKVTLDKCEFLRKEVLYLGHKITENGLEPNDDKIKAVLNFPLPRTSTEIKSFLGLVGYYRKFIKDFSKLTQPLTQCLKKKNKLEITPTYVESFEKCKELLVNAPILQFPDFSRPFILTTDASNYALGAVLSQGAVGNDKPIAYASRTLNDAETRYSTTEKELLAIVWAVKHFRPYLYGRKFTIFTDHRPLAWLNSLKEPGSKLTRWKLRLSEFDFDVIYKSGKQNSNADALSRIKLNVLTNKTDDVSMQCNISDTEKTNSPITISDTSETPDVPSPSDIEMTYPARSPSSSTITAPSLPDTIHSAQDIDTSGIPILDEAVDTKPNQILVFTWNRNQTLVKNVSRDKQKVLEVHLPVDNPELVKKFLLEFIKPNVKYFFYFEDQTHRGQFTDATIRLFKKDTVKFYECTKRVIYLEDENEQRDVILSYHHGKTSHRGIKETVMKLKRNYFWKNMDITVASIINSCDVCKTLKYDRKPLKPQLQLTQTQTKPFSEIFMDIFSVEGKYFLTIIDAFSKLGQAFELCNRSTPEVVRALIKFFSFYGVPKRISADPGSEFNNTLLKETLHFYKIDLHIGTPHNPNSMGLIERFHSTILEIYRIAKYEHKITDAANVMTYAVMSYNQSIHSATGLTPFEVVLGHTDSNSTFNVDFNKQYTQQLVTDHVKRTKYLYKYLTDKLIVNKEKVIQKRGGETSFDIQEGDTIFVKGVNTRRSKDKPRFQKAQVSGEINKNTCPVTLKNRATKVPIKDIKRPSRVPRAHGADNQDPRPSTSKD